MVGVLVFAVMREIVMIMVMLGKKICRWDIFYGDMFLPL